MEDRRHLAAVAVEERHQIVRSNDVGETSFRDVLPLLSIVQTVADDERLFTLGIEAGQQVRPDETGTARYHDHGVIP